MDIKDFDIWYIYSSYFDKENINLQKIAKNFIELDCAQIVLDLDRNIYWKNEKEKVKIDKIKAIGNFENYTLEFPEDLKEKQHIEFAYQGAQMIINSQNLLNDYLYDFCNYIRIYCAPYYLHNSDNDFTVSLYPQIKIFENGIVQIIFRKIGPDENISIDNFVNDYINLYKHYFSEIWIPRGFITIDSLINGEYGNKIKLFPKKQINLLNKISEIYKNKSVKSSDDFEFEVVKLPFEKDNIDKMTFNFDFIINQIFDVISYCINVNIQKPLKFSNEYILDGNWKGIESVYLIDFDDQPTKSENIKKETKKELSKIMYKTTSDLKENKIDLGEDLRIFNDYNLFVNRSQLLWSLSKQGKINKIDPNRGDIIYDKQVLSEMISFRHTLHKRINDQASSENYTILEIINNRIKLNNFDQIFSLKLSSYGEIKELMQVIEEKMQIDKLKFFTDKNFKIKKDKANEIKENRNQLIAIILTIVAVFFSISSLAQGLVKPIYIHYMKVEKGNLLGEVIIPHSIVLLFFILIFIMVVLILKKSPRG